MTVHFVDRVFGDGNYDGSGSAITATGDVQFKYTGNPDGMAATIYHRHEGTGSYDPIYRFTQPGRKIIAMKSGDTYYAVTRGISANTNASLTDGQ